MGSKPCPVGAEQSPFDGLVEATHPSGQQGVERTETSCEERNGNPSLFPFEVECHSDPCRLRWLLAETVLQRE